MKAATMGNAEIPGYIPPWVSGAGGVGGHVVADPDIDNFGGGTYDAFPAPSQGPQTMAQALGTAPTPITAPAADNGLNINIDQQTLVIGVAVVAVLLIFAAK